MKLRHPQRRMVSPFVRHAGQGGGWIPAFAGMTEALGEFVIKILLAQRFSNEITNDTRVGLKNALNFVLFASLVVNLSCHDNLE